MLQLHEDKQPGDAHMKIVARSSPQSLAETHETIDLEPFQAWHPKGDRNSAAARRRSRPWLGL